GLSRTITEPHVHLQSECPIVKFPVEGDVQVRRKRAAWRETRDEVGIVTVETTAKCVDVVSGSCRTWDGCNPTTNHVIASYIVPEARNCSAGCWLFVIISTQQGPKLVDIHATSPRISAEFIA